MTHSIASASPLLSDNLPLFEAVAADLPVLDLACGRGRNGLELSARGIDVTFADRDGGALQVIEQSLQAHAYPGTCWEVDFEQADHNPLAGREFSAILVFNYLHRPLMPSIKEATTRGGFIFYETFTVEQARFGKPSNPDFLLRPGELKAVFQQWEVLSYAEGQRQDPDRAMASLVARRP